jgi:hypothetical protein
MLRISHCLSNRLKHGVKFVNPMHRPRSGPQKYYFSVFGTHFCLRLSKPQGVLRLEGLGKLKTIHSPHWVLNPRTFGS